MKENDSDASFRGRTMRRIVGIAALTTGVLLVFYTSSSSSTRLAPPPNETSRSRSHTQPLPKSSSSLLLASSGSTDSESGDSQPKQRHNDKGDETEDRRNRKRRRRPRNRDKEDDDDDDRRGDAMPSSPTATSTIPGVSSTQVESIVKARVHLVELSVVRRELLVWVRRPNQEPEQQQQQQYAGIYASFCRLDWALHKQDPSSYPMFRDIVQNSKDCQPGGNRIIHVPLHAIVQLARQYDDDNNSNNPAEEEEEDGDDATIAATTTPPTKSPKDVKVLKLTGVVFHESRCGSTLTANLLVAANASAHRVYSESTPPIQALHQICGEDYSSCSPHTAAAVLRDVVYLMSRTDDLAEDRVFFKIQSAGSRNLPVFTTAFPTTPYLFVYRDPVQVMMSHLKLGYSRANCLRSRQRPPPSVQAVIQKYATAKITPGPSNRRRQLVRHTPSSSSSSLIAEDYCAAHLASITETIVAHMSSPPGTPVNYVDLPNALYETILPSWFAAAAFSEGEQQQPSPLSQSALDAMQKVATVYSKNRGGNRVPGDFQSDSDQKEQLAGDAVRSAAAKYLAPSFEKLEAMAAQARQIQT